VVVVVVVEEGGCWMREEGRGTGIEEVLNSKV
jgi:hypothetical protein